MFKISKLADYATVIMHELAAYPEKPHSAAEIAQTRKLGVATVSKLLKQLHEQQLVESVRGLNGGYRLLKSPDNISLAEIIAAIDGKFALTECSKGKNICAIDQHCPVGHSWQYLNRIILTVLAQHSLADMMRLRE